MDKKPVKECKGAFDILEKRAREWFENPQNIDFISKSITNYIFRDGPIESVHSKCRDFTDEDMKEVIIYMVNHIAGLLTFAIEGNWLELRIAAEAYGKSCSEWYPAIAETKKLELF